MMQKKNLLSSAVEFLVIKLEKKILQGHSESTQTVKSRGTHSNMQVHRPSVCEHGKGIQSRSPKGLANPSIQSQHFSSDTHVCRRACVDSQPKQEVSRGVSEHVSQQTAYFHSLARWQPGTVQLGSNWFPQAPTRSQGDDFGPCLLVVPTVWSRGRSVDIAQSRALIGQKFCRVIVCHNN